MPASSRAVAKLWRRVCAPIRFLIPARWAASLQAYQTVLIGDRLLYSRDAPSVLGNRYTLGRFHRQYSRKASSSFGVIGTSRSRDPLP